MIAIETAGGLEFASKGLDKVSVRATQAAQATRSHATICAPVANCRIGGLRSEALAAFKP